MNQDINIFESGWNRNGAYIFGWIMSDGCLRLEGRNKTAYAVRIATSDKDAAEWLHNYMCSGNKIYGNGTSGYIIKYRNVDAIEFMMQNSLTERKSLSMQFPDVPEEFLGDFIRGYFDGDGSIVLHHTLYNTYAQASFTSGSKDFLCELQKVLQRHGISSHLYIDGRETNSSHYLRVIKRSEIDKLFHFMYDNLSDVGFLNRKYEKYQWFEENCQEKYQSHIA